MTTPTTRRCRYRGAALVPLLALTALVASPAAGAPPKPLCSTVIVAAGYPCEDHYPVTEDGFVLGVVRIPPRQPGAPAVILQHGLLDSAATYINNLPSESLGFILYDAGYDVWLGNSRGNTFSQDNNKISKHDKAYWELVDFDLMARYDAVAFVDYVRNATNKPTVTWVGHSQGTTQLFGALSADYGQLNDKVNLFVALAPVAHVSHQDAPFFKALVRLDVAQILQLLGENQFLPNTAILRTLGIACDFIQFGCEEVLVAILGGNPKNMNGSRMAWYLNWEPADTSVHNIIHWTQLVRQDVFRMFDWGSPAANQAKYNSTTPPAYDLTRIRANVALFSGGKDTLGDPTDVALLRSQLGGRVVYDNFQTDYGHLDFVWGLDCHVLIYPQIVTLLKQYAK